MNHSPVFQTGASIPDAHNSIGNDWHERTAQADHYARKVSLAHRLVLLTAELAAAREVASNDQRAADETRSRAASSRQRVPEIERMLAEVNAELGFAQPAPIPDVVHTPITTGLTLSQAMLNHTTPGDVIAKAHGYSDAREHMKARLLASLEEPVRAAIEGDVAAMTQAIDLAIAGKEIEALATANALVFSKAKKEPKK